VGWPGQGCLLVLLVGGLRADRVAGDDGTMTHAAVWVDVLGGHWTIWGEDVDEADAVAVLRALVPVDADMVAAAT
jgi:hypothetical protein